MQLNYQIYGEGEPLIILHGLFGTLENWGSQIKQLSQHYQVIAADMRNHGRSEWSDDIDYPLMAEDIKRLIEHLKLEKAHIIGHSMGGKAAMQLALITPELIDKLIIVDIAPVEYGNHHDTVFDGLLSLNLHSLKSRTDADKQLTQHIDDANIRAFLLKNLYRDENKAFAWRMNLKALHSHYNKISAPPSGKPYTSPVLFIKGGNSDYLIPAYRDTLLSLFPTASYKVIKNAGHWPHAEKPDEFAAVVLDYLSS